MPFRCSLPTHLSEAVSASAPPLLEQRRVVGLLLLILVLCGALPAYGQAPAPVDSVSPAPENNSGDLKGTVEFEAQDSLIILMDEENGDVGTLYNNAQVTYQQAKLEAFEVEMLFEDSELRALGLPSDTGMVGRPRFERGQGGEAFSGDELGYNLRSERGRVVGARTSIDDGFVQGDVVKVMEDSTLYISDATYTTCDCPEDPSYSLRAERMKLQDEWFYTGPIRLYIFNIPTPFWLPFGFLPAIQGRRSGPLPPSYGEDQELGFYLKNWGWYWAMNEYMDFQLQFDFWTRGSWGVNPLFRYDKRYNYSGRVSLDYTRLSRGESRDPDHRVTQTGRLQWSHNQTIDPSTSLQANVNLTSRDYLRAVSEDYQDRVSQTIQSSINFSKRWSGTGRSLRLNLNQQQVLSTGETSLNLPRLSFTQSRRTPFKREQRPAGEEERWYEKITYRYSGDLENRYEFPSRQERLEAGVDSSALDVSWYEALVSPSTFRRATGQVLPFNFNASHRIPVNANFTINRIPLLDRRFFLTLTPNATYTEDWFLYTRRISIEDSTRQTHREPGFFALRQFSSGVSANTTFYGLFPLRAGPFSGLRHTVRPSLSFTYRPDYYGESWGYTRTYTDLDGVEQRYPVVSGVQRQLQQTLSLRVNNVFETKYASTDTTGEEQSRTVKLLDLDLNTNYNVAADSFRLGDVALNARTRILDQVNVSLNAGFSPYQWNEDLQSEVSSYVWQDLGLPRLQYARVSLNTSLQSDRTGPSRPTAGTSRAQFETQRRSPLDPRSPGRFGTMDYVDFAVPWSLSLDLNYSVQHRRSTNQLEHNATLNTRFDFNLTPNWKINGYTGWDFKRNELVTTSLNIMRDLDCWEMSFEWIPFGNYQSYSFTLQVKSGKLRDLLRLNQPSSDVRGRFEGLLN